MLPKKTTLKRIQCIAHVAREFGSIAGVGGIKDVTEGLCRASAKKGIDTHVFMPFYGQMLEKYSLKVGLGVTMDVPMQFYPHQNNFENVTVYDFQMAPHLTLHLLRSPRYEYLFEGHAIKRLGIYQYTAKEALAIGRPELEGKGYHDYFALNVLLVKASLYALKEMSLRPEVIHCHDGHAALLPIIAQSSKESMPAFVKRIATIVTIHNAAIGYHQEVADLDFAASICGIDRFLVDRCLLNQRFDPLLAGGLFANAINTVSENYAHELTYTPQDVASDWLGHTFAGLGIRLAGLTNGVDLEKFNPERHEQLELAAGFSPLKKKMAGKKVCKENLLSALHQKELPEGIQCLGTLQPLNQAPLLTFIGRFAEQKGVSVLIEALFKLFAEDPAVLFVGFGDGEPELIRRFDGLTRSFAGRVMLLKGFDGPLAHQIYGAGDFFLIPSLFEPCGQTDFIAQLMGNLPIAHQVGGLVKVLDGINGFSYLGDAEELRQAIQKALNVYREPHHRELRTMQYQAVKTIHEHFSWDLVLERKYMPLYEEAISKASPVLPF